MRRREYISPSAIKIFADDVEKFYTQYLSDVPTARDPQTQAMSVGSAFDAYAKAFLYNAIYGVANDPRFEFTELFESQVEAHNRDWALKHGKYVFECYKLSGALADLLVDLEGALLPPSMEFAVQGNVKSKLYGNGNGMVLLGKPDVYFTNKHGHAVIVDWKVNGYCSNSAKSPNPGFVRVRHCDGTTPHAPHHKLATPMLFKGMTCSLSYTLDQTEPSWADQLAIYGWLLGEEVGSGFITAIDQIVAKPTGLEYPVLRVVEHRTVVDPEYQVALFKRAAECWEVIQSDHIFRDLSLEESKAKCEMLDDRAKFMQGREPDAIDEIIKSVQPAWKF